MSYFKVGTKDDSLEYFVWADNAQHAVRKVEAVIGGLPPQRTFSTAVLADDIPEGDDVMDEPPEEMESRTDGMET